VFLGKDNGMLTHEILLVNRFVLPVFNIQSCALSSGVGLEVANRIWYRTVALDMEEEGNMEFIDKARIRLEHWIHHSEDHYQEYVSFAKELEDAGKIESARHLKDMITLSARSTECLKKAMKALAEVRSGEERRHV
jgi:hypothetical protein